MLEQFTHGGSETSAFSPVHVTHFQSFKIVHQNAFFEKILNLFYIIIYNAKVYNVLITLQHDIMI